MPIFTGIALAVGALETAATTAAATLGGGLTAGAAAAGSGGLAAAGSALGSTLGAGSIAGGLSAGATGAITAGGLAAAPAATAASAGGLLTVGNLATGAALAGTGVQVAGQLGQMNAAQDAVNAQKQQEALRQKQMQLEADRQRREVIRQTQISQAIGINNAASSGASLPDSSVLSGIVGQNTTNQNYAVNAINQNEAIGNALFASNMDESNANSQASLFKGVGNVGQAIASNNMQIGRLGSTLFSGT